MAAAAGGTRVARRLTARSARPFWVLAASGAAGFYLGATAFRQWQVAIETAQVVAGVVTYPPDNPFYTYHTKLWTLLHQIPAVLLRMRVSELTLTVLLSGVMGMLGFQALALVAYAVSGSVMIAAGIPFLVLMSSAADHGVVYPITLESTPHTYGAVGLSAAAVAIGLIGSGAVRTGGFLLGILPAVHPSIGVWTVLVVAVAAAWEARRESVDKNLVRWWAIGTSVTVVSYLVQRLVIQDVPEVDPAEAARYFHGFLSFWDGHRASIDTRASGVALNEWAFLLAVVWLLVFSRELTPSSRLLLRIVTVFALMGAIAIVWSWLPQERLPVLVLTLMPGRVLNMNVLIFVPLVIGLALSRLRSIPAATIAALTGVGLLLSGPALVWRTFGPAPRWTRWIAHEAVLNTATVALVCLAVFTLARRATASISSPEPSHAGVAPPAAWLPRIVLGAALLAAAALAFRLQPPPDELRNYTNDDFLREVAGDRRGLTVTSGSINFMQLYTRRPVLVNAAALDTLPYAPESGPALSQMLKDVYDLDLFHPPPGIRAGQGQIPHAYNEPVWEMFSRERWQAIRQKYNVTQVVTLRTYDLDLPLAAENDGYRLYRIPD